MIDLRRCLSPQDLKQKVFSWNDAELLELIFYSLPSQFWMIIFFREMTEPYLLQFLCCVFCQGNATFLV